MYKLYYYPNNASLAPHFLLHEMNLEHELVLVDRTSNAQKSEEYLTLNPAGRIPTLIDGSLVMFESSAICIYLCEQNQNKRLIPAIGSQDRAHFYQWLAFLNNTLQAELLIYYYPQKHTTSEESIPAIKTAQEERIAEALSILDKQLEGKQYLLGDNITACDFFLFMLAEWSLKIEKSPLTFPNLKTYLKRLANYPTISKVCEIEGINIDVFQ